MSYPTLRRRGCGKLGHRYGTPEPGSGLMRIIELARTLCVYGRSASEAVRNPPTEVSFDSCRFWLGASRLAQITYTGKTGTESQGMARLQLAANLRGGACPGEQGKRNHAIH